MFNDITSVALDTALHGLSRRNQVTANNIANLETPGYSAKAVKFEDKLLSAIESGEPASTRIDVLNTGDRPGQNGNNVNLERQMITATKTVLQQKLITGAITSRFSWTSAVLKG